MTAYISGVAWELGASCRIGSTAAESDIEGPAEDLFEMGFETFLRADAPVPQLGLASLRRSLDKAGLTAGDVDALIFCTSTYPDSVSRLQTDLEDLMRTVGFRHLNLFLLSFGRCSNVASALIVANNMLTGGEARRVAIVTADKHDPRTGPRNSQNNTQVMSDAAASCIVGTDPGTYRLDAVRRVSDLAISTATLVGSTTERVEAYERYHRLIHELARTIDAEAVDALITHNMAVPSIRAMASALDIPIEKLFELNVPRIAHAFCADGLVNLEDCHREMSAEQQRVALLLTGINTHAIVHLTTGAA